MRYAALRTGPDQGQVTIAVAETTGKRQRASRRILAAMMVPGVTLLLATLVAADAEVLTVEYKLNLVAPAEGEYLVARGEVVKSGRSLSITRADVFAVRAGAWRGPMTLMFQLEVAERICASPGSSAYGRLSVLAQSRALPRLAMRVPAAAFTPPPKVESGVVHFEPLPPTDIYSHVDALEAVTAAAGQRESVMSRSSMDRFSDATSRVWPIAKSRWVVSAATSACT